MHGRNVRAACHKPVNCKAPTGVPVYYTPRLQGPGLSKGTARPSSSRSWHQWPPTHKPKAPSKLLWNSRIGDVGASLMTRTYFPAFFLTRRLEQGHGRGPGEGVNHPTGRWCGVGEAVAIDAPALGWIRRHLVRLPRPTAGRRQIYQTRNRYQGTACPSSSQVLAYCTDDPTELK